MFLRSTKLVFTKDNEYIYYNTRMRSKTRFPLSTKNY